MHCTMFSKKLKILLARLGLRKHPKLSLLIPFSSKDRIRRQHFKWLLKYWKHELPDAEIIIGKSHSRVFCKGEALNHAFKRSTGQVIVVLDADAYMEGNIINYCADRIIENLDNHLWYVPYRYLYRLTAKATQLVVNSDPEHPFRIPNPPPPWFVENQGDMIKYGSRYGAMVTMFPREAMKVIKCFDERFKGWGGEDIAFLRALDTLYGKHKTTNNAVSHLWHPFVGGTYKTRMWADQKYPNANGELASRYNTATRDIQKMENIINESYNFYKKHKQ